MDNQQDKEWGRLLKNGNIHAFNKIYEKYHQTLYRNILKITKNSQIAEDLLQEVFITLWEHRNDIKKEKSLGGWLFVISFNKSVNYMKKELTRLKAKNSLYFGSPGRPETDAVDQYELQHELLKNAINQLSPQKQKTFVLCKLEGKTYQEAAKTLNISKYTVKEYLSSAMTVIKDYIKNHPQYLHYIKVGILILTTFKFSV